MVANMEYLHFAFALQQVLKHAMDSGEWVVIICPEPKVALSCSRNLAAAIPPEARFSGRTALLPGKGRISVVSAQDDIFSPLDNEPFTTAFLGWDTNDPAMSKWHDQGAKTFKFSI